MKTRNNNKTYILAIFSLLMLSSCAPKKDIVYFQDMNSNQEISSLVKNSTQLLSPNDLLKVSVLAFDMSAVALFNGQGISGSGGGSKTYLINNDGFIEFPLLGNIKMAGLTRVEATSLLKEKIGEYVKDPIVNLELENFKITVLGEVARPGVFHINNERVTLLEALGLAGDMTIFGERKSVLVIRENDGKRSSTSVDLTSDEVFRLPVYYLSQNDVVYIKPNNTKIKQSKANSTNLVLSVVGILLSAAALIVRLN
ncbi:MAG: polysaccharide biosynthesis/export family protein [Flavobacteriaceae bacterium]|nr:polysaccharide biosynthesis/export family protein [Flavobacteriaceae bacterium]